MQLIDKLVQIQIKMAQESKAIKPKRNANWRPYEYHSMVWFKQTDEYKDYLDEYYKDNNE